MDQPLWMIRAGKGARFIDDYLADGFVAIGGEELGRLNSDMTDEELTDLFEKGYDDADSVSKKVWMGQVKRFLREWSVGDEVVTYDPGQRLYFLGTVKSDVEWKPESLQPHVREVAWTQQVYRDQLSVGARNSLGAIMTLFHPSPEACAELRGLASPLGTEAPQVSVNQEAEPPESLLILREELSEQADQLTEDAISKLGWDDMQELVAGVLRAMGYRTRVSPPGADRGVDIFASPDGLGLQEPRIFVEVKHRPRTAMSAQHLRSFLGGRQPGDRCLYVSTGGFTKDARYEAERSAVPITLLALPDLRELLTEHYEALDATTRALIPLKRVFVPTN